MSTNNLSVISVLADMGNGEVQDPATDLPLVVGEDAVPPTTSTKLVHWDTEWHWDATYTQYPHQALGGHVVALGLDDAEQVWEEYTYPIFQWAHARNGIAGFAHMQYLDNGIPQSLNCCIPIEYPVEVALGSADFVSEDVDGSDTAIQAYYRLLNTGFRPGFAAGTDYPCNSGKALGSLLTYVQIPGGQLTYDAWIAGIKAGRTVVSRNGHKEFLDLKVAGNAGPGSDVIVSGGASLPVSVTWTSSTKYTGTIELLRNGEVVASKRATIPAGGAVTLQSSASFDSSGWLAARRMGSSGHMVQTGAVFVTVDDLPVRASAGDAQFYVQWMDNLLAKTGVGGEWRGYFPTKLAEARGRYTQARAIYQQIATEAGSGGPKVTGPQSIFTSQSPTLYEHDSRYELGTTFYVDYPGTITGVRVFANAAEGGCHDVTLWRADGTQVYGLPDPGWCFASGAAGWKTLTLDTPVPVEAGTNYVISISNGPDQYYAEELGGLAAEITNGNVHGVAGGGVWTDALGTMPSSVWQNTNYFRDIVFVAD